MAHQIAKLLLEKAGTFLERTEAIRTALSLGMPLREIEDYLDWLDNVHSTAAEDVSKGAGGELESCSEGRPGDSVGNPAPTAAPLPPIIHEAGERGPIPR